MRRFGIVLGLMVSLPAVAVAQDIAADATPRGPQLTQGSPLIDYDGFGKLTDEVRIYRSKRLISHAAFEQMAQSKNVLVIDARSAAAFKAGHIEGAVNLPLPDFTADALAEVIGQDMNRPILIYCNNNFINNRRPVVTKSLPLALNITTFINLYGYGYKNIWELGEAVNMDDSKVRWVSDRS
jgi:phage shock protein E